jgi:DNA-binding transcriptional ArsR family regulator
MLLFNNYVNNLAMKSRVKRVRRSRNDQLDLVFGALGNKTRRGLLARLAREPAMVTELAKPFDLSLPAVSRHIRVLEHAGLIKRTVDGRVHHCELNVGSLRDVDEWLRHYRHFWDANLKALARHVES